MSQTYEQWDQQRRKVAATFDESYDLISFQHGEYESVVYYCGQVGSVYAHWETSTGHSRIADADAIVDDMTQTTRNYLINAIN